MKSTPKVLELKPNSKGVYETMSKERESDGGCFSCLTFIVFCFIMWALFFGVTIDGKHYGISCSMDKGVSVEAGVKK